MVSVNGIVSQCAEEVIEELGLDKENFQTIKGVMLSHFGVQLEEHALYIDALVGPDENYNEE